MLWTTWRSVRVDWLSAMQAGVRVLFCLAACTTVARTSPSGASDSLLVPAPQVVTLLRLVVPGRAGRGRAGRGRPGC